MSMELLSGADHAPRTARAFQFELGTIDGAFPVKEPNHREVPGVLAAGRYRMIVKAFGDAALRLKKGGFDGVELSAAHCHLIDQFWGPHVNFREDEFGGELENRMKFGFMVIERVREASEMISSSVFASPATTLWKAGLNNDLMCEIAEVERTWHARLLQRNRGERRDTPGRSRVRPINELSSRPASSIFPGKIREVVKEPVIAVGRINDPVVAEQLLADGQGDIVAMTRALIADPYLPQKAREGRLDDIRQCMGYNEGCIDRQYRGFPWAACKMR